jgi:hypothetical protein
MPGGRHTGQTTLSFADKSLRAEKLAQDTDLNTPKVPDRAIDTSSQNPKPSLPQATYHYQDYRTLILLLL